MTAGASDGNRTHVSALARPRTNRCTTPAWYLRSHLGSSEIKPHPIWECVFMLSNGTNYGEWCGVTGLNRRPIACKAIALPAELTPHMELPVRFELTTYALLVRCSGQLSYGSKYFPVLLCEKAGEKTPKTKSLWFIIWTKEMALISIHSRITTITELTIATISWITHHISHLSYKINVKGIWMLAEETGLEPARRCRRTVF